MSYKEASEEELLQTTVFDLVTIYDREDKTYRVELPHQCDSWNFCTNEYDYDNEKWIQIKYDKQMTVSRLEDFIIEVEETIRAIEDNEDDEDDDSS